MINHLLCKKDATKILVGFCGIFCFKLEVVMKVSNFTIKRIEKNSLCVRGVLEDRFQESTCIILIDICRGTFYE